jgi:PQQ-dependent dehydrogenase (methanol/ethanol family)
MCGMRSSQGALRGVIIAGLLAAAVAQAGDTNAEWRVLGNGDSVQHYSPLAKINRKNINDLGVAWSTEIPAIDGLVGNPLVANGVVYQSGGGGRVYAHDVRTGKALWRYDVERKLGPDASLAAYWSSLYNRGLAILDDRVFVATGDCALIALDRNSGKKLWEVQACESKKLYGITAAPRVGGGMVFIGNNCIDSGATRGYVDAYDAASGQRRWRFFTVPGDPSKGFEDEVMRKAAATWGTGWYAKSHGCGSVWDAMTFDSKTGLLYIGVGGPAPWSPAMRAPDAGDELFTNSIVALNAVTGKYVWHFKEVSHDAWNLDATTQIMVTDLRIGKQTRHVLIQAPKDGFLYVLDAKTGQFISAQNYLPVTWASGLDPKSGRPLVPPEAQYWKHPNVKAIVSPGPLGARSWHAMAWNPKTELVYFGAYETPTQLIPDPKAAVGGMRFDMYFGLRGDPNWKTAGYLFAWDPVKQSPRWRVKQTMPLNGGVLATGGDLIFQGQADGTFKAYSAEDGKQLWSYEVGSSVMAAPTTVDIDGEQIILVPTGNSASSTLGTYLAKLASTASTRGLPRLVAFKLGAKGVLRKPQSAVIPKPPLPRMSAERAARGRVVFEQRICTDCHGLDAESANGKVKDLRMATAETHSQLAAIVIGGLRRDKGMPAFPDLQPEQLSDIQAFLLDEAWNAWERQGPVTR